MNYMKMILYLFKRQSPEVCTCDGLVKKVQMVWRPEGLVELSVTAVWTKLITNMRAQKQLHSTWLGCLTKPCLLGLV